MKKGVFGMGVVFATLVLTNCQTTEETIISEINSSANVEVDSLEQLRLNRLDSVSTIKKSKTVERNTFTNPPKTVKKKVKID